MECLPKGIDDKNSKSAQALELIERIFAADRGFEVIPTDEIYAKRQEILKPLLDEYWKLLETIDAPIYPIFLLEYGVFRQAEGSAKALPSDFMPKICINCEDTDKCKSTDHIKGLEILKNIFEKSSES